MAGETVGGAMEGTLDAAKGMASDASQAVSEKASELMGGSMPDMEGSMPDMDGSMPEKAVMDAEEKEESGAMKSLKGMM